MKKENFKRAEILLSVVFLITSGLLFIRCNNEEETEDCLTRTKRDQFFGYEVWAGDSALWGSNPDWSDYDPTIYYNIDKHYTLIGIGTTTKTFNTGNFKYYVVAARWYCCIDAIQFADGSYYDSGQGYTLIGGLAEQPAGEPPALESSRFLGPPDSISGNLGYKDLCREPNDFGGFITDDTTIISRGSGLTVHVVNNCN